MEARARRRRGHRALLLVTFFVVSGSALLGHALRTSHDVHRGTVSYFEPDDDATTDPEVIESGASPTAPAAAWAGWGFDPGHRRHNPQAKQRPPFTQVWAAGLDSLAEFPPVVDDEGVFIETFKGSVVSFDPETGQRRWTRQVPPPLASSPALDDDRLYISSLGGVVLALRRSDGKRVWRHRVGARTESSPLLVDGTLYFGAENGTLTALDCPQRPRALARQGGRRDQGLAGLQRRPARRRLLRRAHLRLQRAQRRAALAHRPASARAAGSARAASTRRRRSPTGASTSARPTAGCTRSSPRPARSRGASRPAATSTPGPRPCIRSCSSAPTTARSTRSTRAPARSAGASTRGRASPAPPRSSNDVVYFSTFGNGSFGLDVNTGRQLWRRHEGRYSPVVATRDAFYFTGYNTLRRLRPRSHPAGLFKRADGSIIARGGRAVRRS